MELDIILEVLKEPKKLIEEEEVKFMQKICQMQ